MNGSSVCQLFPIMGEIDCFHRSSIEGWLEKTIPYHRHDAYEIFLFIRGDTNNYVEQACYRLAHGDLIIMNPDELHRVVCSDLHVYERICINIKKTVIEKLSSERTNLFECFEMRPYGEKKIIRLSKDQINHYVRLADDIENLLHNSVYGSDVLVKAYLSQLLVLINSLYKDSTYKPTNIMSDLIRDTMLYIKNHIEEPIYLDHLSKHFYLNGTYISREFKKYTGLTLRSYILGERIAQSKSLLCEGKNVSEACFLAGFSDYSNFIRSFTKIVGVSPGIYKKSAGL